MRYLFRVVTLVLTLTIGLVGQGMAVSITLQNATATFSQVDYTVPAAIDGDKTSTGVGSGWAISDYIVDQTAVFETDTNVGFSGGTLLTFLLYQEYYMPNHLLGRFRLSITTDNRNDFADGLSVSGDVTANWSILTPNTEVSLNGATMTVLSDNSILVSGTNPSVDTYTVTAITSITNITGVRLEVLEDSSLPFSGPGRRGDNGNFVLTELTLDATEVPTNGVPEPATMLLLGLGLMGIAGVKRKFQK